MDKIQKGIEEKSRNMIVLLTILVAMIITVYALFKVVFTSNKEYANQKEEEKLSYYSRLELNITIPSTWKDISVNEKYLFATIDGVQTKTKCPTSITLKEPDVIRYVTLAPMGVLAYKKEEWYIANVSKRFSTKEKVATYLKVCIDALDVKSRIEKNNVES